MAYHEWHVGMKVVYLETLEAEGKLRDDHAQSLHHMRKTAARVSEQLGGSYDPNKPIHLQPNLYKPAHQSPNQAVD